MAPYYGLPLKYCENPDLVESCSMESSYKSQPPDVHAETAQRISEKLEENIEDAREIDIENIFKQNNTPCEGDFELSSLSANVFPDIGSPQPEECVKSNVKTKVFRGIPTEKFVWNSYILECLRDQVHPDWLLNIIHGFVGQSSMHFHSA